LSFNLTTGIIKHASSVIQTIARKHAIARKSTMCYHKQQLLAEQLFASDLVSNCWQAIVWEE